MSNNNISVSSMGVADLFHLLESNKLAEVEEMKKVFHDHLSYTAKDNWLVNGLFDYYLCTNSSRAIEVLAGVREPHDKHLLDRLMESMSKPGTHGQRVQALTLLGHIARRQPTWLYKLASHPVFKDLLRVLKVESDALLLMSSLLLLVMLLPILPAALGPHLQEICEVFGRLASYHYSQSTLLSASSLSALADSPSTSIDIDHLYLLHLQVGLYGLFHRLYALYPCNFIAYLKCQYTQREQLATFTHTVRPMLDSVRMHPSLVTSSKETEVSASRWKKMEHHDVMAECGRFTLDKCQEEPFHNCAARLTSPLDDFSGYRPHGINVESMSMQVNNKEEDGFWSPSMMVRSHSPPLPVLAHDARSAPSTPNNNSRSGTSPPEAAIEATPETTPVKDARKLMAKQVPIGSNAVRSLNTFGNGVGTASSRPSTPTPTPTPTAIHHPLLSIGSAGMGGGIDGTANPAGIVSQKMNKLIAERQGILRDAQKVLADGSDEKTSQSVDVTQISRNNECWQEDQEVLEVVSTHGNEKHGGVSTYGESRIELHDNKKTYGTLMNLSQTVCHYRFYAHHRQDTAQRAKPRRAISCPQIAVDRKANCNVGSMKAAADGKRREDNGTQTSDILSYEHLLLDILDQKCQFNKQPPLQNTTDRLPISMLDRYIEACTRTAYSPNADGQKPKACTKQRQRKKGLAEEEMEEEAGDEDGFDVDCTSQLLQLMQMQLQFERQQREVHAERNRRLLGKLRDSRALEKHNKALAHRIRLLEQEVEGLRTEIERDKKEARRAKEQCADEIQHWQSMCVDENQQNRALRDRVESLELELKYEQQRVIEHERQTRAAESDLFEAAHQLRGALKAASRGKELESALDAVQRRFLLLGEAQSKLLDNTIGYTPMIKQEVAQLHKSYTEELGGLRRQLESRASLLEAMRLRLSEMENKEARKEAQLLELQRLLQELKERHGSELEAVESKYKAQVEINLLLEGRLLELHGTLEAATCGMGVNHGNLTSSASPKERSPPLSASLASSSEGSLAFIQSGGAGIIMNDCCDAAGEIPNLQAIIEPASSQPTSPSRLSQQRWPAKQD